MQTCGSHPVQCKRAVISGEMHRMLLTCKFESDFDREVVFFVEKLRDRGYPLEFILPLVLKIPWASKGDRLSSKHVKQRKAIIPLKLIYSDELGSVGLNEALHAHFRCLPDELQDKLSFILCYRSAPNLFRKRYRRFM